MSELDRGDPDDPADERVAPGVRARHGDTPTELLAFLPDVARLVWRLLGDPRVPVLAKVGAGGALAYVASPVDLVPDWIPVLGSVDDLWVLAAGLRGLVRAGGYDVAREHWDGSDDGFALLLVVAGVEG